MCENSLAELVTVHPLKSTVSSRQSTIFSQCTQTILFSII